jgi:hypothetical protein
MSLRTVGDAKDGIAGILSGTNLDRVTNLYKALERAARKLVQKADILEATETVALTLYNGVYDYPISDKIFGGGLIDIKPQGVTRWYGETVIKKPMELFDRTKATLFDGTQATFEFRNGVPIMRVASTRPMYRTILDSLKETTGWTAAGSASGLAQDNTVYYESPSSLRFTLTGSSTGTLTKNLSNSFLALRLPDGATATNLTSVSVRIGSDSTNYDEVTDTEGFLGAWTVGAWLLVALDMSTATSTGTPDWTAIDYLQFSFAHTATITNVRVGGFWLALPSPHEIVYQTAAIFYDNATRSRTITDDDTEIVLSDAAFTLFEHESALAIALQTTQNEKADQLRVTLYGGEGPGEIGLYAQYRGDNPSQELRSVGTYYDSHG